MNTDTTFNSEIKLSFSLFLPLFLSQLVYAISTFIGTALIAHMGKEALAGLALGAVTYTTLCVFFFGIFVGISILIARSVGAKEEQKISGIVSQGFTLAILCSIVFCTVLWYVPCLFSYFDLQENTINISAIYLRAISFSVLPWIGTVVLEQFLIGISLTKLVLLISVIQVPFEILINYIFVFGKLGLPEFGIAGLGYGFTATFCLSLVIVLLFICRYHATRKYNILKDIFSPNPALLKELFLIGLPVGVMNVIENLFFLALTIIIGLLGTDELASQQIIRQYIELTVTIGLAMTQATTVRVSNAVGARNISAINTAIKANMTIVVVIMSVVGVAYIFAKDYLIAIDLKIDTFENLKILEFTSKLFFIAAFFQIFDGVRLVAIGVLRSLNDKQVPMYITVGTFWIISMPLAYIFGFKLHAGIVGVWSGILIGMIIGTFIIILRLRFTYQKNILLSNNL